MAAPLKILHVMTSLEPGGLENGVVNIARGLDPLAFETYVACLERGGEFASRLPKPDNVTILHKQPGFSWSTVTRLMGVIRRVKPQVIHTHNLGPLIYGGLATFMGRWKSILHGEHGQLPAEQQTARRLAQRRRFYSCCRSIHTVSGSLRDHLVGLGLPGERMVVLLNGVDTVRYAPADRVRARQLAGLPPEALTIGIVGRFVALKRHLVLLEAFNRLGAELPAVHLLIVGDGGEEGNRIRSAVNASPARDRIHLAGFQRDPVPWYQAMDLLVVPSIIEGLSNVVLEAMACGVPVLAHQACGNSEIVTSGENGVLAMIDSVDSLHGQLRSVLSDPVRLGEMGRRARGHIEAEFAIQRMINRYAAVYRQVAGADDSARQPARLSS